MKKELSIDGYWWLPENPENEVFGTMGYIPGGSIVLSLNGILNVPHNWDQVTPPDFITPKLIQGIGLEKGKEITLYKCTQTGSKFHSSGIHTTTFVATFAFFGSLFDHQEDIRFNSISVRFNNFEEWANQNPFSRKEVKGKWEKQIFRYDNPNQIEFETSNYEFKIAHHGPNTSSSNNKLSISYKTRLEIISNNEQPYEKFHEIIRRAQNFFGLAMGTPTFPIEISGKSGASKSIKEDGQVLYYPIDIYYPVAWWPERLAKQYSASMLFTLQDIKENIGSIFANWLDLYEIVEPALNLFFSVLYNPNSYVEIRFLSLAQAIETYHRRKFGGVYMEKRKYLDEIYPHLENSLPDKLTDSFKDSILGRMRYLNEYSLRKRMTLLIQAVEEVLEFDFVQSPKSRNLFTDKVVNTRNYWTHYTKELKGQAPQTSEERLMLLAKLQLLLEVHFLIGVGFDSKQIKDLINKSQHYQLLGSKIID